MRASGFEEPVVCLVWFLVGSSRVGYGLMDWLHVFRFYNSCILDKLTFLFFSSTNSVAHKKTLHLED